MDLIIGLTNKTPLLSTDDVLTVRNYLSKKLRMEKAINSIEIELYTDKVIEALPNNPLLEGYQFLHFKLDNFYLGEAANDREITQSCLLELIKHKCKKIKNGRYTIPKLSHLTSGRSTIYLTALDQKALEEFYNNYNNTTRE